MNVRVKYTEVKPDLIHLEKDFAESIKLSLNNISEGETLFILPTYTALLEIRKELGKLTKLKKFWK